MKESKDSKPKITPPLEEKPIPTDSTTRPPVVEYFYRPKRVGGYINLYAVEMLTVEDDVVVNRKMVTERDNRNITLSKILTMIEDSLK